MPTYIVQYTTIGRISGDRVTLHISGTEAAVVAYLRDNVEPAWGNAKNTTLGKYIAEVINYRDSEGGCCIWGIYKADGTEIRELVNGYEWEDNWEPCAEDGERYAVAFVTL